MAGSPGRYNVPVDQKKSDSPRTGGDGQVRLHKALANAGLASRRACEDLIARGAVAVNGEVVVRSPVWVNPAVDRVTIDGKAVRLAPDRLVYVMLYKPRNTVTTLEDPDGRRTVASLVEHPSGERLYPVGRLHYDTMGLLLMTNDGELANRLTHPRYEVEKTYRAVVKGVLDDDRVESIRLGLQKSDRRPNGSAGESREHGPRSEVSVIRRESTRTIIDITLREGGNLQVRQMLADVGCPVRKLVRIRLGPLTLKGVPLGAWRELTSAEVQALRWSAGLLRGSAKRKGQAEKRPGQSTADAKSSRARRGTEAPRRARRRPE